ncbi:synaptotagmin-15-like, partial [Centruroides sculpturatus]|uniref:synaptotagmin-15-like n=1 Tax=Centruroides sculpturatus TaxID=218467 RepID=UPI000C6CA7FD
QNRSIDFVVPNITTAVTSLPSPVDTVSLSSGSSPDVSLWARLALLEGGGLPGTSLLGGLNPELYKVGLEEPEEEIYFPDGNKGRIWFGVEYDASSERLVVHLIKVKNLPSRVCGSINCCDPFVRISLMPDERRYLQSKQKKKTCNPRFEETFIFQIPVRTLNERAIKLTVYDNDRGKRYNVIGHVIYPLRELNGTTTTETLLNWRDLEKEEVEVNLFRSIIFLCSPKDKCFSALFLKLDSYVKVTFLKDNKVAKTKKTVIAKKTTEPKYNESFNFRLTQNLLNSVSVILQVTVAGAQKDKILGRVVLGSYMFARGKPLDHWNESMSAGYRQVRHWHKLT